MNKYRSQTQAIRHIPLQEWQKITPDNSPLVAGVSFNREPAIRQQIASLNQSSRIEILELVDGLQIRTFQHVGNIRIGGINISIQPKIDGVRFLSLLRYAYGWRKLELFNPSILNLEENGFQEILIFQLLAEAKNILGRGLYRKYECIEENLQSPRGRIDFNQFASNGGLSDASLFCRHYMRLENNLLNQTLLAGLRLGSRITKDLVLRAKLRKLSQILDQSVSLVKLTPNLIKSARIKINRLTEIYRSTLSIIEILLSSHGISFDSKEADIKLPGFLFDMNRFYQALLFRFLSENLVGYDVQDEFPISGMLAYHPKFNPLNRRAPTIRPDFAIIKDHQVVALLDAKYRDLWDKSFPRNMMYQLAMYAFSQEKPGNATILYPTTNQEAEEAWINVQHPISSDKLAKVVLRPVNLLTIEELINTSNTAFVKRERANFANKMVFG
ncbi:MAG TPA: restriction endonuclease [Clostridiales bacterium]|nr:restriction endonuclease [Clostridiales bacterium]